MKKQIISILAGVGISLLALSSCDLDVTNPTEVSSGTFWETDKDVWGALNDIYSAVIPGCEIYGDCFSDDVRCPYPWESNGSTFQTNGLSTGDDMGYNFIIIRRTNDILEHLDDVEMDEALRERVRAEVRLLRAWDYAGKTLAFGKVPLMTKRYPYTERNIKRDEVAEVRKFIIDEMKAAAPLLPESYPGGYFQEKSRLTRYAAYAVLARTALNFGDFKTAEEAALEVMKGPFTLHHAASIPDAAAPEVAQLRQMIDFDKLGLDEEAFIRGIYNYRSIWDAENVKPGEDEYVLVREFLPGNADYTDLIRYTSMRPDQMVVGWSSVVPQQPLIDAYWTADGKPAEIRLSSTDRESNWNEAVKAFKESGENNFRLFAKKLIDSGDFLKQPIVDEYRNRDARFYASIMFHFHRISDTDAGEDFVYEWQPGGNNESTTGYNFIKMVAKDTGTLLWGDYPTSEANFPSIRFAEILLIYAEAHTHNSGYDSSVTDALDKLRERVGMPSVPKGLSQEEGLKLIRNERRIELAGEGFRLNDIRRYGKEYAREHMGNVPVVQPNGNTVITLKWDDRMMLFPIPQTAIDVNPILKDDQNPGY